MIYNNYDPKRESSLKKVKTSHEYSIMATRKSTEKVKTEKKLLNA